MFRYTDVWVVHALYIDIYNYIAICVSLLENIVIFVCTGEYLCKLEFLRLSDP